MQMASFLTFLVTSLEFGGGSQSGGCPGHHQTSARTCLASAHIVLRLDNFIDVATGCLIKNQQL